MNSEEILAELNEQKQNLQALLKKFIKSDMLGLYLPTEYESQFKRIEIEVSDLLDEYFGKSNKYSNEISSTIINKTGGFLPGITYAGVSDIIAIIDAVISRIPKQESVNKKEMFVESNRILELKSMVSQDYDLTRLIKLLDELNIAYSSGSYMTCTMICRAILDHIPPIFGFNTFIEVSNNYGGKSFKGNSQHLQNSLRNIADNHLHLPIRKKEVLPNQNQINFSNDLDVVLSEIVRLLK